MSKETGVGLWKTHKLVKCVVCKKLMGYHTYSEFASCVECTLKGYGKSTDE